MRAVVINHRRRGIVGGAADPYAQWHAPIRRPLFIRRGAGDFMRFLC
jgi:hypothetical protein